MNNKIEELKKELVSLKSELDVLNRDKWNNSVYVTKSNSRSRYIIALNCVEESISFVEIIIPNTAEDFYSSITKRDFSIEGFSAYISNFKKANVNLTSIITKFFSSVSKRIKIAIENHIPSYSESGLIRDKLVGRFFKINYQGCKNPKTSVYHLVGSTDTDRERPFLYNALSLKINNPSKKDRSTVECSLVRNGVDRSDLLDPDTTIEITESEFMNQLKIFKEELISLVGENLDSNLNTNSVDKKAKELADRIKEKEGEIYNEYCNKLSGKLRKGGGRLRPLWGVYKEGSTNKFTILEFSDIRGVNNLDLIDILDPINTRKEAGLQELEYYMKANLEPSDNKKLVKGYFDQVYILANTSIRDYKKPKTIKYFADKVVGKYFKIMNGGTYLYCRILPSTDNTDGIPNNFSALFIRPEELSCGIRRYFIPRRDLIDPEITIEITEEEFLGQFNKVKDKVLKLIGK